MEQRGNRDRPRSSKHAHAVQLWKCKHVSRSFRQPGGPDRAGVSTESGAQTRARSSGSARQAASGIRGWGTSKLGLIAPRLLNSASLIEKFFAAAHGKNGPRAGGPPEFIRGEAKTPRYQSQPLPVIGVYQQAAREEPLASDPLGGRGNFRRVEICVFSIYGPWF